MAKRLVEEASLEVVARIVLNEDELAALDALAGYGADQFIDAFYKVMGESYLKPHVVGVRSLFATIREEVAPILSRARDARAAFKKDS